MNFLSHYFFYKTKDPYYNTGLILPDLVKNYCNSHINPIGNFNRPALISLAEGSLKHLECDKKFHNSEFFKISTHFLSAAFDAECQWPRKWFLNHLLMEILLDRVLMDKYEKLCEQFYYDLSCVNIEEIGVFLKMIGLSNPQNFQIGFERFVNSKFIFEYQHNEKICFALNKVYQKVGINYEWTNEDNLLIQNKLPEILEFLKGKLDDLSNELKL
jgi:hypothetical protein